MGHNVETGGMTKTASVLQWLATALPPVPVCSNYYPCARWRAGWSSDRINGLQDKADAIRQATSATLDANDFWSCKYLEKVETHTAALFRYGEVAAGERAVEKADYSEGDLARQWRQQVRTWEKNTEGTRK